MSRLWLWDTRAAPPTEGAPRNGKNVPLESSHRTEAGADYLPTPFSHWLRATPEVFNSTFNFSLSAVEQLWMVPDKSLRHLKSRADTLIETATGEFRWAKGRWGEVSPHLL